MESIDPLAKVNLENMELITEIHDLKAGLSTLRKHSKEIGRKFTQYYDSFFEEQKTVEKLETRLAKYGRCLNTCASRRWKPRLNRLGKVTKRYRVSAGLACNCGWKLK